MRINMATINITITFPDAAIPPRKEAWPATTNAELKAKLTEEFLGYVFLRLKDRRKNQAAVAASELADTEVNDAFGV